MNFWGGLKRIFRGSKVTTGYVAEDLQRPQDKVAPFKIGIPWIGDDQETLNKEAQNANEEPVEYVEKNEPDTFGQSTDIGMGQSGRGTEASDPKGRSKGRKKVRKMRKHK